MGTGIPLLNEYKQEFFAKRFPQTILGGPKLRLGYDAPIYVYINQVLLFLIPFILGGTVTLLVELDTITDVTGVILYGCLMLVVVMVTHIITTIVQVKCSSDLPYPTKKNLLAEEDEIDFMSCCGVETFEFIVPRKKFIANIAIHAVISGCMCGLALWYLLPATLNGLFSNNTGATVILFIFGWFTVLVAQYPLTVAAPPEPATYRTMDTWEISPLTRPFYILVFSAFDLLYRYESQTTFLTTNQALHILFVFLPVLWTCGFLPPVDCFFLWLGEQVHVHLFGGSPMASEIRLVVLVVLSVGVYLGAFFFSSCLETVLLASLCGYLLSTDLGGLGNQIIQTIRNRNKVSDDQGVIAMDTGVKGFLWGWGVFEFLYHALMLALVGVTAGLLNSNSHTINGDVWRILGYVTIGLCVLEKILRDVQSVYIFFGLLRNRLFPRAARVGRPFHDRRRKMKVLGITRRIVLNWVAPLTMLAYASLLVTSSDPSSVSATKNLSTITSVWYIFGVVRIFRAIWQNTANSLLEISITHIILVTVTSTSDLILFPILSLLIGLCRDRATQFLNKLYFCMTILITSWTDKKQRRGSTVALIGVSVFLFPLVLSMITLASALSAPLLPLFTLPLFVMGFPRPNKFWPEEVGASANVNPDTMFYKQLTPVLSGALRTAFADGRLGEACVGNHYLVRYQDRLVWIMILERGAGYCTVSIKGLELQETSCHTAEAARLDDIFEEAFPEDFGYFPVNHYPLHTLTLVDVEPIKTYSDARNVLTGIIDQPGSFDITMSSFIKSLVWVLLHHVNKLKIKEREKNKDNVRKGTGSENNNNVSGRISKASIHHKDRAVIAMETYAGRPSSSQQNKMNTSWGSLGSFTDSIFSEDEFTDRKKTNTKKQEPKKSISPAFGAPAKPVSKFDDDIEDLMNDFELGLPALDKNKKTLGTISKFESKKTSNGIFKPVTNLAGSPDFKCSHSVHVSLPQKWRELPLESSQVSRYLSKFPKDWFKYVLGTLDWSGVEGPVDQVKDQIARDDVLINCYSQLVMACYSIFDTNSSVGGASTLYKFYVGDLPWNAMLDWLSEDKELYKLVLKAYRYGFKMMLDQTLMGEATTPGEFEEYLMEFDKDWYIGLEKEEEWKSSVLNSVPNLFSLGHNKAQGTYSSRLLTLQEEMVYIGRLNSEAVKGQWANLSLELLYFTNDDEERYSIQAHPTILRNLTVQAADPPLGYPIFSSKPITIPTV
ncbi:pecanex-like protein 4 [Saccostrea echinata]|uniref:pecanex-like protein 4 n=1 Tax=Saccostrea echinata TaxID=191078 RepID=UPI002A840DFF|nr:pecanex-like protein 4 [Saccostrea echinata]